MSDEEVLTPAQKQYQAIKKQYPGTILFFRMGDFYETFDEDAEVCSRELGLTLTTRNKNAKHPQPLAGIPYHAVDKYLPKLNQKGYRVAICEQTSDPKLPGIVERKVVRVVTPGTTLSDTYLEAKTANYLAAITENNNRFGLSWVDLSTGHWAVRETNGLTNLLEEIRRLHPAETVLPRHLFSGNEIATRLINENLNLTWYEALNDSRELLLGHFATTSLAGFGLEDKPLAVSVAGVLLNYLIDTQKTALTHLQQISFVTDNYLYLDAATIRNLELFNNSYDYSHHYSLLSILDETVTALGGRKLKEVMLRPLLKKEEISARHEAVEELLDKSGSREELRKILSRTYDLERLLARLATGHASGRDLVALRQTLLELPTFFQCLSSFTTTLLKSYTTLLPLPSLDQLCQKLTQALEEEVPLLVTEGGIFRSGYHAEIDRLRSLSTEGKNWLANYQQVEQKRTGIPTLKIKFNNVFGYFIELTQREAAKGVPENYIRKQTLVNAERFITPELKTYEEEVMSADQKLKELEYTLFQELRTEVLTYLMPLQQLAEAIAWYDVLSTLATVAARYHYHRPKLSEENMVIDEGRHPILETTLRDQFVPNEVDFTEHRFLLLTGPNMAGKSTFLRQNALICYLNQIGSFVPAEKAVLPLVDRIFTRVGASDFLSRGRSTFMVEMEETANILNNATARSLIILDEIGRGTSTYDGLALAWSITEYLHNIIKAKTIFATHYHELIPLAEELPQATNLSVAVMENEQGVVFLHKIVRGGVDKSYGVEVAKLAGIPTSVIDRAKTLLMKLEQQEAQRTPSVAQTSFLAPQVIEKVITPPHPFQKELTSLNLNDLTPLQALNLISDWKAKTERS